MFETFLKQNTCSNIFKMLNPPCDVCSNVLRTNEISYHSQARIKSKYVSKAPIQMLTDYKMFYISLVFRLTAKTTCGLPTSSSCLELKDVYLVSVLHAFPMSPSVPPPKTIKDLRLNFSDALGDMSLLE